jgi:hypothetical protein
MLKLPINPVEYMAFPYISPTGSVNTVSVTNNNSNTEPVLATSDTGATGTYIQLCDMRALQDVHISTPGEQIVVAVANGTLFEIHTSWLLKYTRLWTYPCECATSVEELFTFSISVM